MADLDPGDGDGVTEVLPGDDDVVLVTAGWVGSESFSQNEAASVRAHSKQICDDVVLARCDSVGDRGRLRDRRYVY